MLSSSPAGFTGAKWTKRLCLSTLVASILISLLNIQPQFLLQWSPQLAQWGQWRRILLNPLVWTNQGSAMIGGLLLYDCRGVERQIGSRRYAAFVLEIGVLSMLVISVLLAVLALVGINVPVQAGPQAIVAALVSLYHTLVPNVYFVKLAGVGTWSDKSLMYFLLLVNCTSWGSFLKVATGWVLAKLIYTDAIPGRLWAI